MRVAELSEAIIENPEEFLQKFGKERTFVDAVIDFLKEIKNTIVANFGGSKAEAARVDNALMALEQRLQLPNPEFDILDIKDYNAIKGKKFILIDDNCSTGRTFVELKRFIEKNGGTVVDYYASTVGADSAEKMLMTEKNWRRINSKLKEYMQFAEKNGIERKISRKGLTEREGQELLKQYKRFSEGKNEQNSRTSYEGNEGSSGSTEKTGRKEKSIENNKKGTSSDVSNSLPENKKAEKKARQKKEKAAENKLTDFGEKIGGARKDDWRDRGLDVNDIAGMTDKEKAKFITKDNIWKKPNYEALIKEGKDKNVTCFLKTVRDGLPTKPEFCTTNKELVRQVQEEYVKQMGEFTDLMMLLDIKEKIMEGNAIIPLSHTNSFIQIKRNSAGCSFLLFTFYFLMLCLQGLPLLPLPLFLRPAVGQGGFPLLAGW